MPTIPYHLADGSRVPGVTTVISTSLGWNREALMWWANQEGLAGRNYRDSQKQAADAGTFAHAMVEAQIHGEQWTPPETATPEQLKLARLSFDAWKEWITNSRIKFIATEPHLVSEEYRFGGTPDAIGKLKSGICLLDWKTSKGIYAEYLVQLAAYEHLWNLAEPDQAITGGIHACRFDKTTGGFAHHFWPCEALRPAWEAFLALRRLYDLQREMKALAA
jgi:hypothetical protein